MNDKTNALLNRILAFRDERDWEQFHTPKNLAAALVVEASELLALFQWTSDAELAARCAEKRDQIEQEIADTYIYLLFLAHALGIDLDTAAEKKMALNAERYPANRARGNARKYSELPPPREKVQAVGRRPQAAGCELQTAPRELIPSCTWPPHPRTGHARRRRPLRTTADPLHTA